MKRIVLLMFLFFVAANSYSQLEIEPTTVTTSDILAAPITDSSCHNYCFTGVCVWLSCGLHGCSIETSLRVRYYNPDLVVSVYDESGTNLWNEAQQAYGGFEASSLNVLVGSFHNAEPGHGQRTDDNPVVIEVYVTKKLRLWGTPGQLCSLCLPIIFAPVRRMPLRLIFPPVWMRCPGAWALPSIYMFTIFWQGAGWLAKVAIFSNGGRYFHARGLLTKKMM